MTKFHLLLILALTSSALAQSQCGVDTTLCEPSGATSLTPPQIKDANFPTLYKNLLESSLPSFKSKRSSLSPRQSTSLCCISTLSCLTIADLGIPFCYDRFTTNYFLPDNSFGTLVGGAYTSSSGDTANFRTGEYSLQNGEKGNLYSKDEAAKSSIAALSVPPQWTSAGVGSAIPASALGGVVIRTFTTTLPGTVIPATTIEGGVSTITVGTVIVTTTVAGSTRPARTIEGSQTVITTTERTSATGSDAVNPSATGESDGERMRISEFWVSFCLVSCSLILGY